MDMQSKTLLGLPNDVLQLIAKALMFDTLFTPRYTDDDFEYHGRLCKYTAKCKEYYGGRTVDHEMCAQGLLSWSVSNKYFRAFLSPYLFDTVVLRDKPKSIASVKALIDSVHWNHVRTFVYATTLDSSAPNVDEGEFDDDEINIDCKAPNTTKDLRVILSRLPPNLKSLTIDVPEGTDDMDSWEIGEPFPLDTGTGMSPYRSRLRDVLICVSANDISKKGTFELQLLNLPPYHSLAYGTDRWKAFLSRLSSFVLGFQHYHNGAGWQMNTQIPPGDFAFRLDEYFWDHLVCLQSFSLQGDKSWPLGAPDDLQWPLELPLPSTRVFNNLRHVSFKNTFICKQMAEFLRVHLETIETVNLVDCTAPDMDHGDTASEAYENGRESWATFFSSLNSAKLSQLRELNIYYVCRSEDDLLYCFRPSSEEKQRLDQVRQELRAQEHDLRESDSSANLLQVRQRQKRLLAYCTMDDEYGIIMDRSETNVERFLGCSDHEQWLRLVDLMQKNVASTVR